MRDTLVMNPALAHQLECWWSNDTVASSGHWELVIVAVNGGVSGLLPQGSSTIKETNNEIETV